MIEYCLDHHNNLKPITKYYNNLMVCTARHKVSMPNTQKHDVSNQSQNAKSAVKWTDKTLNSRNHLAHMVAHVRINKYLIISFRRAWENVLKHCESRVWFNGDICYLTEDLTFFEYEGKQCVFFTVWCTICAGATA